MKEARGTASSIELEFCAIAYYGIGKAPKTLEYLDKCLKKHGNEIRTLCLRGAFEPDQRKADSYFDQIPEEEDITSAIGKYFQLQSFLKARQHAVVQKELESILQINSHFTAGRILMCQTAFGIQDWEVLLETATTIYSSYPKYYDAHMYVIVEALLSGENYSQCHERLSYFISMLEKNQELNISRCINYCRILIGLVGDNKTIGPLISDLLKFCPESAESLYLNGRLHLLRGNTKKAQDSFNKCMSADPSMIDAFCGLVWCLIKDKNPKRAKQQLEMAKSLMEASGESQITSEIYLLEVILDAANKLRVKIV